MIGSLFPAPEVPVAAARVDVSPEGFPPAVGGLDFWSMLLIALSSRSDETTGDEASSADDLGTFGAGTDPERVMIDAAPESPGPGVNHPPVPQVGSDEDFGPLEGSVHAIAPATGEPPVPFIEVVSSGHEPKGLAPHSPKRVSTGTGVESLAAQIASEPAEFAPQMGENVSGPADRTRHEPENESDSAILRAPAPDGQVAMVDVTPRSAGVDVPDAPEGPERSGESTVQATIAPMPARHAGPVDVANTDMGRLVPELQDKLDRVIGRMRREFGHEVTLVEGYRSPERQEHLHDQGRTRPGPVVTWTRNSQHSEGRAADVMIDGAYTNEKAYARLQAIATEEGIRTLGAKDPGHLEVGPKRPAEADLSTEAVRSTPRSIARPVGVMRVAAVARVASVARVTRPGGVVAPPDAPPPGATPPSASTVASHEPRRSPGVIVADGHSKQVEIGNASERVPAPAPDRPAVVDHDAAGRVAEMRVRSRRRKGKSSPLGLVESSTAPRSDAAVGPSAPVDSPRGVPLAVGTVSSSDALGALERVEQILETRDMLRSVQPSRISLNLGDDGPITRLRVGLLRGTVDADMDLADGANRSIMTSRVSELHRALMERGLELGSLGLGTKSQAAVPGADSLLPGGLDSAMDVMRSLLAGATDSEREGRPRDRTPAEHHTKQDGADSQRSRRETNKENNQ